MVFNYVQSMPGSHLREISRRLGFKLGHLRYHLNVLEKKGLIISVRNGYYKRYFTKKQMDVGLIGIFFALRQKNTRRIVLHLLNHPDATHKDLLKVFDFPSSTLSLYLNNLIKKKVVERIQHGRENRYKIINEEKVIDVLKTYKGTFVDKFVDRALEIYEESHY